MSPVHVIVGDDPRAETMWNGAFTGAVDLYRFERNVDAFERLTAAQAPIDMVVLTPAQRGPFNLTPDQFVARVLEGPLGSSRFLANLHVIVVGQPLQREHPRAMAVSTLDAAIRLVKFGEVEQAPMPAPVAAAPTAAPRRTRPDATGGLLDDLEFSGSIISRIWEAGRDDAQSAQDDGDGWGDDDVLGGGPALPTARAAAAVPQPIAPAGPAQLFSRSAPKGFVAVGGGGAMRPAASPGIEQAPQVGAPGESIEVASGTLQPSRPYQLPNGGGYRGPAVRGGTVHGAGHGVVGQPVPPALIDQVHSMVYGGMQVGNPHDPMMVWSSTARGNAVSMHDAAPIPMGVAPAQAIPQQPPASPVVPMEPPPGAYGGQSQQAQPQVPAQSAAAQGDPFLQRAESGGGAVSFG